MNGGTTRKRPLLQTKPLYLNYQNPTGQHRISIVSKLFQKLFLIFHALWDHTVFSDSSQPFKSLTQRKARETCHGPEDLNAGMLE